MNLTPLENFRRMMEHRQPQRLPLDIWVTPPIVDLVERQLGTRHVEEALSLDVAALSIPYPVEPDRWRAAYEQIGFTVPTAAEIGVCGHVNVVPSRESVGAAYHLRELLHPLAVVTSVEQLRQLPWPDVTDPALYAALPAAVAAIHHRGKVAFGWMACTIFEWSWYQRGMDNLLVDLVEGNAIGPWLLDWFTERSVRAVEAYCRAGVDVIGLGDDVATQLNMMMSLDFWREHLKPRLRRVIEAIHRTQRDKVWVFYHSDGNVRDLIPDLIEIGVDILNPVQPECMPVAEVIPQYRQRLGFWGAIGTQTTMPFGKPPDVRAAVRQLADLARQGAAIVVAPTHVLEPDVPWENIRALVDEVHSIRL